MVSILVVEDDEAIRRTLTRGLTEHGATVTAVATAVEAINALPLERPDAVMLDLGLPDLDGADVLALIRATSTVPVIIATARDDEREIVRLLDAGADDYLIKPFSAAQAMARVRAVLRRTSPRPRGPDGIHVGDLVIDPWAGRRGSRVGSWSLNRKEFDLLSHSPPGSARSSRSASCWPRCGRCPGAEPTGRSTCTCPGCAASSGRPRPSPATSSVRGVGVKLVDPGPR